MNILIKFLANIVTILFLVVTMVLPSYIVYWVHLEYGSFAALLSGIVSFAILLTIHDLIFGDEEDEG